MRFGPGIVRPDRQSSAGRGGTHDERHDERLSDEELELFVQYLHRFANHDVDIFLALEAGDAENPVYVMFGRDYPPVGDASDCRRPFADRRQPTSTTDVDDGG